MTGEARVRPLGEEPPVRRNRVPAAVLLLALVAAAAIALFAWPPPEDDAEATRGAEQSRTAVIALSDPLPQPSVVPNMSPFPGAAAEPVVDTRDLPVPDWGPGQALELVTAVGPLSWEWVELGSGLGSVTNSVLPDEPRLLTVGAEGASLRLLRQEGWEAVPIDSLPIGPAEKIGFGELTAAAGRLFVSTWSGLGSRLWHSTDGVAWEEIDLGLGGFEARDAAVYLGSAGPTVVPLGGNALIVAGQDLYIDWVRALGYDYRVGVHWDGGRLVVTDGREELASFRLGAVAVDDGVAITAVDASSGAVVLDVVVPTLPQHAGAIADGLNGPNATRGVSAFSAWSFSSSAELAGPYLLPFRSYTQVVPIDGGLLAYEYPHPGRQSAGDGASSDLGSLGTMWRSTDGRHWDAELAVFFPYDQLRVDGVASRLPGGLIAWGSVRETVRLSTDITARTEVPAMWLSVDGVMWSGRALGGPEHGDVVRAVGGGTMGWAAIVQSCGIGDCRLDLMTSSGGAIWTRHPMFRMGADAGFLDPRGVLVGDDFVVVTLHRYAGDGDGDAVAWVGRRGA